LEDAFRKLRIRRGAAAQGIPYELLIPGIARQLMLMAPNPRSKALPPKKALRSLTRSVGQTIEALDRFPESALDALNYKQAALRKLVTNLRILHFAVKTAEVACDHIRKTFAFTPRSRFKSLSNASSDSVSTIPS
jgi:hypothetical protein